MNMYSIHLGDPFWMSHIRVISLFPFVFQQMNVFGAIPRKYTDTDIVSVSMSVLDLYPEKTSRMRKTNIMMPFSHCIISSDILVSLFIVCFLRFRYDLPFTVEQKHIFFNVVSYIKDCWHINTH